MKRILLAGVAAGIALFLWEYVAHMATPLGVAGFKTFPDEPAMVGAINATFQESGLYLYPTPKPDGSAAAGPAGILLVNRRGFPPIGPAQLGAQLAFDLAAMVLLAALLARLGAGASFGTQLLIALTVSLYPTLRSEGPQWLWYGYPKKYVAAQLAINVIGFAIAGAIAAKAVRRGEKARAAAA